MINSPEIVDALEQNGFAVLHRVVDASTILDLIKAVERLPVTEALRVREKRPFGIRNLLEIVPLARRLGHSDAYVTRANGARKECQARSWPILRQTTPGKLEGGMAPRFEHCRSGQS